MHTLEPDVAIIGAGTAGLNARREVERRGGRPLLIERGPYGTTCARVGCMPSKLLIAAAEAAHAIAAAPLFGVRAAGGLSVDGPAVMRRVRQERDRFVAGVVRGTEAIPEDQLLRGHARFIGPTTLLVEDEDGHPPTRVSARSVVIAAGSTPVLPPPFDAVRAQVLTSDEVFELPDLPTSLAVIGTGTIALELGQAFHRLGVRVAFFNPFDAVGPFADPEMAALAKATLGTELDLRIGAAVLAAEPATGSMRLRWRNSDGTEAEEHFVSVLVAAGRKPNLAGLDLAATGLALDPRGLPSVDHHTTQCGDAPIFMAGDIDGSLPLLHEAADEGRIAGENAMRWPEPVRRERRTPLAIAFTDPQMAIVGTGFAGLPPGSHAVGEADLGSQGRARVMGRNRGAIRVYAETSSCRLLGAELFGPNVEHLAHLLAWAVQQRMTVQRALTMPIYHPVLEEGLRSALRDLADRLDVVGQCRAEDMAEAPGN